MINSIGKSYFAHRKYTYTRDEILSYQDTFLVDLMTANKDTLVGKKYNFAEVYDYETFKKNIPVFHYDEYKEYIYMSVQGEQNIICSDDIDFWAKTSGTTSDYQKYIPVTKRYLENNHYKGGKDTFSNYISSNPDTKLFEGKGITIGGAISKNDYTNEDNVGNISAIIQINNNILINYFFTEPEEKISFLSDWNHKISKIIESCKDTNITSTIGVASWSLYLLKQLVVSQNLNFVDDIWPDYELFLTGGMNYIPLSKNIYSLFRKSINIRQVYNACEGYIGSQFYNNDEYMHLLLCHDIYYEFLLFDDYELGNFNKTINIFYIKANVDYIIIITNSAGLYRYILGDTIKFINTEEFIFEITGRNKLHLDSFSERVRENHTDKAIFNLSKKYNLIISDYHVGVIMNNSNDGSGYHMRIIELDLENINYNNSSVLSDFEKYIDTELIDNNITYNQKRSGNILLQNPVVQLVPKGTFAKRFASKGKLGGQHKIPKLRNDDTIIKEIIDLL